MQTFMRASLLVAALAPCAPAQKQINGPLRGPVNATAGGTAEIEVGSADSYITVSKCPGDAKRINLPPSKTVILPIPSTPGEILTVVVGRGLRRYSIQINIVTP